MRYFCERRYSICMFSTDILIINGKIVGIYGNKLGYLGGINCNIMVAFICQLYPNSSPSTLLFRFFKLYHEWKWPEPVMFVPKVLCKYYSYISVSPLSS